MRVWDDSWGVFGWDGEFCWFSVCCVVWFLPYDFVVDNSDAGEVKFRIMVFVKGEICERWYSMYAGGLNGGCVQHLNNLRENINKGMRLITLI